MLGLLSPQPGERILDVGCGDGALTNRIVQSGAQVLGVDTSTELLEVARGRVLEVRWADAAELDFAAEFDAVFSNAALHWVLVPAAAATGMFRALRPGGRLAVEFGGFGNIAAIMTALRAVLGSHGYRKLPPDQYYPTAGEYSSVLAAAGFVEIRAELVARPTPLADGMDAWLRTFRQGLLDALGLVPAEQVEVRREVVELLEPSLRDEAGNWIADYVRIRATAVRG